LGPSHGSIRRVAGHGMKKKVLEVLVRQVARAIARSTLLGVIS
jgi:hypothetical protein